MILPSGSRLEQLSKRRTSIWQRSDDVANPKYEAETDEEMLEVLKRLLMKGLKRLRRPWSGLKEGVNSRTSPFPRSLLPFPSSGYGFFLYVESPDVNSPADLTRWILEKRGAVVVPPWTA
ncbi:hypothetical protein H5410_045294 [Solanum commersonii]|uniref:Uncharacterized protein n=1 Tax=Solanum commersonii TaxID=4109 RepID=A0A9J5XCB5_SOLCO|nr:hypothetical protein H5410_045294 [Solanum commersonii]